MGKPVAVQGEIKATAGTTPFPPADTGSWTPGPVVEVTHQKLGVKGKLAVLEASCIFTFSGSVSSTGAPVVGVEVVQLKPPAPTILLKSGTFVLLDGDKMQGTYGNTLEAAAAGHLTTA
jgi:hypothetical protein